jgi:phosphatidylglycerol lysyltransferase
LHYQYKLSQLRKIHWKELVAVLFILFGVYFFRQERHELRMLVPFLRKANSAWILTGIAVTFIYIFSQSVFLLFSFKSVKVHLRFTSSLVVFLKRDFISVFVPGGGAAAFAYLPSMMRKEQIEQRKIFQAAGINSIIGTLTVIIVGLPVIIYALLHHQAIKGAVGAFGGVFALIFIIVFSIGSLRYKGRLHQLLVKYFPKTEKHIEELFSFELSLSSLSTATLISTGIEFIGVFHLYIAMMASGANGNWEAAFSGYVVSTLFLVLSPFLKGLGAVELSLTYILTLYGYSTLKSLEITLLYRVFEFWLPLTAGLLTWLWKGKNLFLRLLPPVMIFVLGIVNIFSVLTPPIATRLRVLREYLPIGSIHASNWMIILIGIILMITATYLIKGLKGAWWLAIIFSGLSLIGHLTKAFDYEEAIIAFVVIGVLLLTRKQYRLHSSPRFINIGLVTSVAVFLTVLIFGTIGFYLLDKRHYGFDFTWQQSLYYAFSNFLLIANNDLHPITHFGNEFIISIKVLGFGAWIFLFYTIIRPYINKPYTQSPSFEKANFLLSQYGTSSVDHFKLDSDKLLFISEEYDGFIAYKIAGVFAIVLEEPVCTEENKIALMKEFEKLCTKMGLKTAFYRVDENSLYHFEDLKKKKLLIGQEAIMDIRNFSLEGKQNKSLRNGLNSLSKKGYAVRIHHPPHNKELLWQLQQVSNTWLNTHHKKERVFSQGMFTEFAINQQDIIALHDQNNSVAAFLNIIPDYAPEECTYDLIRKTAGAPGAAMDALIVKMIEYAQGKGANYLNLGLVPMSGIGDPENTAESIVKYAYEKIKRFSHYKGLREFKEKYASAWLNKYLIYENDFDLIQLPAALNKIMQPTKFNR